MSKLLKKFAYADMGVILSVTSLCIISLISLYQLSQNGISASLTSGYSRRAGIIQAASVLAGLFGGGFCILADSGFIRKACLPVFFITIILSVLTLTPLGVTVADDRAWLRLGTFSIQPSELMKAAMIPALAFSLTLQRSRVLKYLLFACFSLCACTVVYLQRDIGSLLIFAIIILYMLFSAGTSKRLWATGVLLSPIAAFAIWRFVLGNDQRSRILSALDPSRDPYGAGYQQLSAKNAITSGGLTGRLSDSGRSFVYVASSHNDFLLSFIAQLFGTVGIAAVCLLIVLLLQRLMKTDTSQGEFASFIRVGAFALFAGEAILNIGMNLSVLPVIGIPLPFVSAGGTAMAAGLTLIGAALSAPGKGKAQ